MENVPAASTRVNSRQIFKRQKFELDNHGYRDTKRNVCEIHASTGYQKLFKEQQNVAFQLNKIHIYRRSGSQVLLIS